MTRWGVLGLAAILVAGGIGVGVARFLGKSGSRASIAVSVAAHWLGAWALWSLAGGLALRYGALATYDGTLFAVVAPVMAFSEFRIRVRAGREPGLALFVGGQLVWLVVVLAQNGWLGN